MKKMLKKEDVNLWHILDGKKIDGVHNRIMGNVSGIRGDVSGITGDVDDCKITDNERIVGININDLVC